MREVSVFCDESGGENGHSRYCIIALVFHEQGKSFDGALVRYRRALRDASLEDVPFHASPLMYGKGDYAGMSLEGRKGLFMSFFILQKALPYRFKVFSYRSPLKAVGNRRAAGTLSRTTRLSPTVASSNLKAMLGVSCRAM